MLHAGVRINDPHPAHPSLSLRYLDVCSMRVAPMPACHVLSLHIGSQIWSGNWLTSHCDHPSIGRARPAAVKGITESGRGPRSSAPLAVGEVEHSAGSKT